MVANGQPGHARAAAPGATTATAPTLPPGLTAAQREAVSAEAPVLCVLAGAGTGKTRVLTLRVARRIHDGSAVATRTLVCTFSRKAADELRRRLWGLDVDDVAAAGTFHRMALRLLHQRAADGGGTAPVVAERRTALLRLVGPAGSRALRGGRPATADRERRLPSVSQLDTEIGWAKARMVAPADYEDAAQRAGRRPAMGAARIAELYGRYEADRRRRRVLDLDDLLLEARRALEDDARFAAAVRWRYRHVYVDEMQDVNPAQFGLLMTLVGDTPDLCVVGDPNQSVYGWNGADPTLLDRIADLVPGTRVVRLDENHRCSPQVVAVAASVLDLDADRVPTSTRADGPLPRVTAHPTDADEAAWVAREVWRAHRPGRRWSQIAVLARTNVQLGAIVAALDRERVPCRVAGGDLGPASDLGRGDLDDGEDRDDGDDRDAGAGAAAPDHTVGVGLDTADGAGEGPDPEAREDHADAVVVSTFHRAKGLQWPAVFVIGLSDGLVPIASARTDAAREEERRLLYVALTRAERELSCSWAAAPDAASRPAQRTPGAGRAALASEPQRTARQPSPWLVEVVRRRDELAALCAPVDPADVAAHIAELRARLSSDPPRLG